VEVSTAAVAVSRCCLGLDTPSTYLTTARTPVIIVGITAAADAQNAFQTDDRFYWLVLIIIYQQVDVPMLCRAGCTKTDFSSAQSRSVM